jgi:hypothetical protein
LTLAEVLRIGQCVYDNRHIDYDQRTFCHCLQFTLIIFAIKAYLRQKKIRPRQVAPTIWHCLVGNTGHRIGEIRQASLDISPGLGARRLRGALWLANGHDMGQPKSAEA